MHGLDEHGLVVHGLDEHGLVVHGLVHPLVHHPGYTSMLHRTRTHASGQCSMTRVQAVPIGEFRLSFSGT